MKKPWRLKVLGMSTSQPTGALGYLQTSPIDYFVKITLSFACFFKLISF